MANGFDGGKGKSVANQEIVAIEQIKRKYYEFHFVNTQDCSVIVNGSNPIPCPAGAGFIADSNDAKVITFKIVESNIDFTWRGKY